MKKIKNIKKRFILLAILVLLLNIVIPTYMVDAKSSVSAAVTSDTTNAFETDVFTVTLKLDKFDEIKKGLNAYRATIEYDREVFEEVSEEDFTCLNNWERLQYNANTHEFVAINRAGIKESQEIVSITFRVKKGAKEGMTEIRFKDIVASEGIEDLVITDQSIGVSIIKKQTVVPEEPGDNDNNDNNGTGNTSPDGDDNSSSNSGNGNGSNNGANSGNSNPGSSDVQNPDKNDPNNGSNSNGSSSDNGGNGSNNNGSNSSNDDSNKKPSSSVTEVKKEDKISSKRTYIILLIIIVIIEAILLILAIIKRKKDKDDENTEDNKKTKKYMLIIVAGLISVQFISSTYAYYFNSSKMGELNGDGEVNYTDLELLEYHLVNLRYLEEQYLEYADMNFDGHLTVTDLSLFVQKLEDTLEYEVKLENVSLENYNFEKNSEATLYFKADVNYGAIIKSIIIDGNTYEVTKENDSNLYSFKINVPDKAGVKEFNISEVILNNDKKLKVKQSIVIDVLKDKPEFKNYEVKDDINTSKKVISFDVVDNDLSMTNATLNIYYGSTLVKQFDVQRGYNNIEVDVVDGKKYNVQVVIKYDLTSPNFSDEQYVDEVVVEKELLLNIDYNFKLNNIKTYKDKEETLDFAKDEQIKVGFDSSNATIHEPISVTVNGKKYEQIIKENNRYYVLIDGIDEFGKKDITIEEIKLGNGKVFPLLTNNGVTVNIIKREPIIYDLAYEENIDDEELNFEFKINDDDETLESLKVVLYDENNNEISNYTLTEDELKSNKITKTLKTTFTDKYKLKVIAKFIQKEDVIEKVLLEQEIVAEARAEIKVSTPNKIYYNKKEVMTVNYSIETNKKAEITKIVANDVEYIAEKVGNGLYKISVEGIETSGVKELITSKIIFNDGTEAEAKHTTKIEILKDAPSITNPKQADDVDNGEVTFTFDLNDEDESFISGVAVLINAETQEEEEYEIKRGHNEITMPLENAKPYKLELKVTYDLDTNELTETDNKYELVKLGIYDLVLLSDYELTVDDIKAIKNNVETKYFNKNEKIKISFVSTNISNFKPVSAVINGNQYDLTLKDGRYEVELPSYDTYGVKEIKIEKIVLNNSHEEELSDKLTSVNILKDQLSVENFTYERTNQNKLRIKFDIIDKDNVFEEGTVKIINEANTLLTDSVKVGENIFETDIDSTKISTYKILINSTFNLDSTNDEANRQENIEIFNHQIELSPYVIELKDVTSNKLFYKNEEVSILDITSKVPTDLENYYVVIEMKNAPSYYANVEKFVFDSNSRSLSVVIKQNDFIKYEEVGNNFVRDGKYSFKIKYQDASGVHTINKSAQELFDAMKANPTGTFTLTEDLDAEGISTSTAAVGVTFKGTLDGQGHKIKNLPTVLFASLQKATIKNLVIEKAVITNNSNSILANSISNNSEIINTHIIDSSINNNTGMTGAFAGSIGNSSIKQSSAVNISIRASNTIGGIAGQMNAGSVVENCYVTGSLTGTINHGMGTRVGGITGWDSGTRIEKVYTNVTLAGQNTNGGLIGGPSSGNPTVRDAISMGSGAGYRLAGFNTIANMTNVYEYSKSTSKTHINANVTNIKEIDNLYDKSFYKNTLGFDESIWNLDLVENGKLPILKNGPLPQTLDSYEIEENKNNIPNYKELRLSSYYRKEKEILYHNMAKLKPFADTRNWLELGNSFNQNAKIANTKIKFVVPLDSNGKIVTGLTLNTVTSIKNIRIVYEDEESETYEVEHLMNIEKLVSTYKIKALNLEYEFNNYISVLDDNLINRLVTLGSSLDYAEQIASITSETESRLYVDFYNESVKANIRDVITKYMLSEANIPTYINNKYVSEKVASMYTEENLKKLLYAYNYIEKWYHLDLDGIKLSDFIFFNGQLLNQTLTPTYMIDSVVNTSTTNRATNKTVDFYNAIIKGKTGMNFLDFLPYVFKTLNGYDDPSDWIIDHFDGIIHEQPAIGTLSKDIKYRIWPIMTTTHQHVVLPILSAPNEDMYIISCPSQFVIGSMNRYSTYLNKDGKERERMTTAIKNYGASLGLFYGTAAGFIPNSVSRLNSFSVNAQYDTRFGFPASDKADAGTQSAGTTRDPVMKWVYEAIGGAWAAANGSGAYANGYNVWWVVDAALGGVNRAVHVFTHETAHNQDNKYFYSGNGRRPNTGAESHADGVIAQDIGTSTAVFNLIKNFAIDTDYATNLTYERINTEEKINSYYREMYETKYVLEYLAGQAFLKLTPEEQAKIGIQMQHNTTGSNYKTTYVRLTADDFRNMNLKTMSDLWDNQIAIRGTGSSADTWTGRYGYDSFFNLHFYIPNNPNGAPDVNTFKNTGFEMLGYAGYDKGFITYMSGRSKNDLQAIIKITSDDTMTWKKYKLSRYDNVAKNLNNITFFDIGELLTLYENAMKSDAKNGNLNITTAVTQLHYGLIKRATNDFTTGTIYNNPKPISITSAQQLIDAINNNSIGNYRIDADLDFSNIEPVEGQTYYIKERFLGSINGNGHKLKGMEYTLFNSLVYANVMNLTIEEPHYGSSVRSFLAVSSKHALIYNNHVIDSNVLIPNIVSKSGNLFSLKDNTVTLKSHYINSIDDFLAIGESDETRKQKYVLNTDLDFSNVPIDGNAVITGIFSGVIEGNGHSISNLNNASLFVNFRGTVNNLKIKNFTNTGSGRGNGDFVTAFTQESFTATFKNLKFENITLSGRNNVSVVSGMDGRDNANSVFENISVTNSNVTGTGVYVSNFVGRKYGGSIKNVYIQGTLNIVSTENGGLLGAIHQNPTIENVITDVSITKSRNVYSPVQNSEFNGSMIGNIYNNPTVKNSIAFGNMTGYTDNNGTQFKPYKFTGALEERIVASFTKCYEVKEAIGFSRVTEATRTKLDTVSRSNLNANFYKGLGFDETLWNYSTISTLGHPVLK